LEGFPELINRYFLRYILPGSAALLFVVLLPLFRFVPDFPRELVRVNILFLFMTSVLVGFLLDALRLYKFNLFQGRKQNYKTVKDEFLEEIHKEFGTKFASRTNILQPDQVKEEGTNILRNFRLATPGLRWYYEEWLMLLQMSVVFFVGALLWAVLFLTHLFTEYPLDYLSIQKEYVPERWLSLGFDCFLLVGYLWAFCRLRQAGASERKDLNEFIKFKMRLHKGPL